MPQPGPAHPHRLEKVHTMAVKRLSALNDFVCLGSRCPDNCCSHGWRIDVDEQTYDNWNHLPDGAEKQSLLTHIDLGEEHGRRIIRIALDESRRCPHLQSDMLCGPQVRLGAEVLPAICRTYPRISVTNEIRSLASAQLSCPEMARLVLFASGDRPLFVEEEAEVGTHASLAGDDTTIARLLDGLTTAVLEQKRHPLNVRVVFLARRLALIAAASDTGSLTERGLEEMCRNFRNDLYETGVAVKRGQIRTDPLMGGMFWSGVYGVSAALFETELAGSTKPELLDALSRAKAAGSDKNYREAYETLIAARNQAKPLLAPYAPALDRYLQLLLMNHGFPWNPVAGNYIATFVNAIFPFATSQLLLWMVAATNRSITEEQLIGSLYRVERSLTHSWRVYRLLDKNPSALKLDRYMDCLVDVA